MKIERKTKLREIIWNTIISRQMTSCIWIRWSLLIRHELCHPYKAQVVVHVSDGGLRHTRVGPLEISILDISKQKLDDSQKSRISFRAVMIPTNFQIMSGAEWDILNCEKLDSYSFIRSSWLIAAETHIAVPCPLPHSPWCTAFMSGSTAHRAVQQWGGGVAHYKLSHNVFSLSK